MQGTQVRSLGWEDPLEKEMATHSRVLAWEIPWTEEPGGLQSVGSQRVRCDSVTRRRQRCFEVIDRSVKIHDWSQYVSSLGKK